MDPMRRMFYITTGKKRLTANLYRNVLSCSDLILPLGGDLAQAKYLQFSQCTPFYPEGAFKKR